MALVGIVPARPREPRESPLVKLAAAVSITNNLLGTALAVPKFMQERRQGKLAEAESRTKIGQETEEAKPGEPGAFEVPGMGVRKSIPSLSRQLQEMSFSEKTRLARPLTSDEREEAAGILKKAEIDVTSNMLNTLQFGDLQDLRNRAVSRQTLTTFQEKTLGLQEGREARAEGREARAEKREERLETREVEKQLKLSEPAKKKLDEGEATLDVADRISDQLDDAEIQDIIGGIKGRIAQMASSRTADKLTLGQAKNILSPKQLQFARDLGIYFQEYRKRITGAQASYAELGYLEGLIPSLTDSPEQIRYAFGVLKDSIRVARAKQIADEILSRSPDLRSDMFDRVRFTDRSEKALTEEIINLNGKVNVRDLIDQRNPQSSLNENEAARLRELEQKAVQ